MKTRFAIVASLVVAAVPVAMGAFIPIGDPFEGYSWGQTFAVTSTESFDLMAVRMTSEDDAFESDVFRDISADGWTTVAEVDAPTPTLAVADGPTTQALATKIIMDGDMDNQLEFDFVTLEGETVTESVHAVWTGTDWTMTTSVWVPTRAELVNPTPVPAPSAVLLGMLGLVTARLVRRAI